jgi:type VI secretion system protein ImpK
VQAQGLGRIAGDLFGFVLLFGEASEDQRPSVPAFRNHVLGLLDSISKHPDAQQIPADELEEARFALVAWADETVLRSDWSGRDEWLRELLQLQLFRTNRAGDEFYDHLARLRPDQNHAREVYFLCLVLGFEGRYAGHQAERAEIMRQQFELMRVAGRALDLAGAVPLAPPAYELEIRVRGAGGRRLWPVLLSWLGAGAGVFAVLWLVLRLLAAGVPVPPGL